MTEPGYTGPATMAQLQAQIAELRKLLVDILSAVGGPAGAEESKAALKLRLLQQVKNSLKGPQSIEAAIEAVKDPEAIETALEALGGLPHGTKQVFGEEGRRAPPKEAKELMERLARLPHRRKP